MINFDVVSEIPTTNKTIFLLSDLDVPIDNNGNIIDDEKIKRAMKTIDYLVKTGARVVIATHLGYPASEIDLRFSTKVIADYLDKRMYCEVRFSRDCIGDESRREIFRTGYGDIIVLENLLFYKEEKECDLNFARKLAEGTNVYVNDAFNYSNYGYASVLGVPMFIRATAGLNFTNEIKQLNLFVNSNENFSTAIIGGRKFDEKFTMLNNLLQTSKSIVVCGEIANTFLVASGKKVGKSIFNKEYVDIAENLIEKALKNGCLLQIPEDVKTAKNFNIDSKVINKTLDEIEDDDIIIDIGDKSIERIYDILDYTKCCFWYGAIGAIDFTHMRYSTQKIAEKITSLTKRKKILSFVSGKDTISVLKDLHFIDKFSYVSYATESVNQYISGKVVAGVEVLKRLSKQLA